MGDNDNNHTLDIYTIVIVNTITIDEIALAQSRDQLSIHYE